MNRKGYIEAEHIVTVMVVIIFWIVFFVFINLNSSIDSLKQRLGKAEATIIEQQAFIRNQRNNDQDIWDMLNQHSEHIGLIWERIP